PTGLRVRNHALELWTVVRLGRESLVAIEVYHVKTIALRSFHHVLQLKIERAAFDLFRRTDTGVAGGQTRLVSHRYSLLQAGTRTDASLQHAGCAQAASRSALLRQRAIPVR